MTDLVLLAGVASVVVALLGILVARLIRLDERLNPYASSVSLPALHVGIFLSTKNTTTEEVKALTVGRSLAGVTGFSRETSQHRRSDRGWVRSSRHRRASHFGVYDRGYRLKYGARSSAQIVRQNMPHD